MKSFRQIALALLFLAFAPSLHAQWAGTLNMSGGYCQMPSRTEEDLALENALGKAGVQMTYKTRKLLWETNLNGQFPGKRDIGMKLEGISKTDPLEVCQHISGVVNAERRAQRGAVCLLCHQMQATKQRHHDECCPHRYMSFLFLICHYRGF